MAVGCQRRCFVRLASFRTQFDRASYQVVCLRSATKLDLMKRIDKLHLAYPHMGSRSIQAQLNRQGIAISRKRLGNTP